MSLRAYKIKKITLNKYATLNVGQDEEAMRYLESYGSTESSQDNLTGIFIDKDQAKDALKQARSDKASKETIEILKQVIKDCGDNDFVEYKCF